MRRASLHPTSLVLLLGLALACAREGETNTTAENVPVAKAETEKDSDEPRGPVVGERAPALALDSLAGGRVQLPVANSDRASVLIFGSFS
jgi:hypothetical protein